MAKKDFFGKLLSNRRNDPSPWDSNDSADGRPDVDVEEAPSSHEDDTGWEESGFVEADEPAIAEEPYTDYEDEFEDDEHWEEEPEPLNLADDPDAVTVHLGGDGQDSALPEVSPSYLDEEVSELESPADELDVYLADADFESTAPPVSNPDDDMSYGEDRHHDEVGEVADEIVSGPIPLGSNGAPDGQVHESVHAYEEDSSSPAAQDAFADAATQHQEPPTTDERLSRGYEPDAEVAHASDGEEPIARTHAPKDEQEAAAVDAPEPRSEAPSSEDERAPRNPASHTDGTLSRRERDAEVSDAPPAPRVREASANGHAPEPKPAKERPKATRPAERRDGQTERPRAKTSAKTSAPAKRDAELRGLKDRVVVRMLQKQIVTPEQVKGALRDRTRENLKATLWRIVAQQRGVDRERVYREAALTYAFVERKLEEKDVDLDFIRQVADVFPEKRRNRLIELRVVPVGYEYEQQTQQLRVVFLTHDPSLPAVRALMQELNLERYELQYASETTVKELLAKAFPRKNEYLERMTEDPLAYDLGMSYEDDRGELIDEEALEAEINRSSLINLFEAALVEAVHKGASDIHIYPNAKRQIEIHFRVDGRLMLWHLEDKVHPESLLAVIKDNTTNVDRFEREMAQDGFIQRKVDDTLIRYRVSILPIATAHQSIHAESIVIRVLDDRKVITDLSQLGLLKGALERFDMAIRQPHGMVILTGPTGSGKSTTLVAALHQVVNQEINTLTVEDPVEYIIPGVRQIKLNHKLNLEQALRSILRHDPDVVMVGEMRDRPTAELAIKLANTGHLTFSTLHTNDAPSAVSRLYKMGVEPFLIAYAINLVVAQRLIRSLCPTCKTVDSDPDPVVLDRLGFTKADLADMTFYKASGDSTCKSCKGSGYKGRRAISEALYFTRTIRHLVVEADSKIDEDELRDAAKKEGMLTLQDSAREVVKMGETSIDEMMRVTAAEE